MRGKVEAATTLTMSGSAPAVLGPPISGVAPSRCVPTIQGRSQRVGFTTCAHSCQITTRWLMTRSSWEETADG